HMVLRGCVSRGCVLVNRSKRFIVLTSVRRTLRANPSGAHLAGRRPERAPHHVNHSRGDPFRRTERCFSAPNRQVAWTASGRHARTGVGQRRSLPETREVASGVSCSSRPIPRSLPMAYVGV